MKSLVMKRSVILAGHKTSVSVEDAFWQSFKEIAVRRHLTVSALLTAIDSERHHGNLSSAIRLFVLTFYRDQVEDTHKQHETVVETVIKGHGYRLWSSLADGTKRREHDIVSLCPPGPGLER
jgi:predicted DNA-binding ribbon-helix-helix protein